MATYDFEVSAVVPAGPEAVYRAWLSSAEHSAMTGGTAVINPKIGGAFTAWDGYISGATLELEPHRRVVQSWRTTEFDDDDPDSTIEVLLDATADGTLVTVQHRGVPEKQLGYELGGWNDSYFEPMIDYFSD